MPPTDEPNLITAQPPTQPQHVAKGSRLISKVLSPAIQLWLRSQVEAISGLKFQIRGSDREILRGCVPNVEVQAEQIVYQGLHLSQVDLAASQIQINLGQVLQGKPLRLLEVVPVIGTVRLTQTDLNASTNAALLKQALADFLLLVLHHLQEDLSPSLAAEFAAVQPFRLEQPQIRLVADGFILTARLQSVDQPPAQVLLEAQLRLTEGSQLVFAPLKLQFALPNQPTTPLNAHYPLVIDLGAEVHLSKLELTAAGVWCQGRINVVAQ